MSGPGSGAVSSLFCIVCTNDKEILAAKYTDIIIVEYFNRELNMDVPATAVSLPGWQLSNTYGSLPAAFYTRLLPTPVADPRLLVLNENLAEELGLKVASLRDGHGAFWFSGNQLPPGAEPMALAYAGHQFGHFTLLGDGRAVLLGEQTTPAGARYDVQLKGAGATPYSRRGDGRAVLGPMLREYAVSEAMHALGVSTSRSLAVVDSGEGVMRETMLPGAILTRIASSHIRVGTFEYAATLRDPAALKVLADYAITRHYPALTRVGNPYLGLLEAVAERQAALVAGWMHIGFIHGVMNTDNMSIAGETIDYGPCAFMDTYGSDTVFSSIDQYGRYAYGNQPPIALWNLTRFAETLLPLIGEDVASAVSQARAVLEQFEGRYEMHWLAGMRSKLGLLNALPEDKQLVETLLEGMQRLKLDFTCTFSHLTASVLSEQPGLEELPDWSARWRQRLSDQSATRTEIEAAMRRANPVVIPRNHQLERALRAAEAGDISVFLRLLDAIREPYNNDADNAAYRLPPTPEERVCQTFCGT